MLTRRQFAFGLPLLLAGCDRSHTHADRPLFAADSQPWQYPTVQAMAEMDRILAERSGGELRLRIYPGGQLGSEHDTLEITLFGGLDLNRVNLAPLNAIAAETLVLALPFLFSSTEHLRRSLDGEPGRRILDSLVPHGLRGLCYYDSGERCFYNTRRPIRTPDDMRGMKIRVPGSDTYVAMVQALGANPTPIPFGEVYQALVQGVVDGAENNWPSYESTRHFEAARHFSLTRHVLAPEVLVASERSWQRLDPAQRQLLQEAADESVPFMRRLWDQRVEESRARVLAAGVELVEDVDLASFRERMLPVWDRLLATPELRGLADSILALDTEEGA